LKILKPDKMMSLGNYAMYSTIGFEGGIMKKNGDIYVNLDCAATQILSIHPSMVMYSGEKGKDMLRDSIFTFKNEQWRLNELDEELFEI